MLKMFAIGLNS